MNIETILTTLLAWIPGALAILWAYTKYVLEKELLPPVQFNVSCAQTGLVGDRNMLDIKIHLHNLGSATLVAQNIRLDLKYMRPGDREQTVDVGNGEKKLFKNSLFKEPSRAGRVYFQHSLIKEMGIIPSELLPNKITNDAKKKKLWQERGYADRGFLVLEYDTFVKSGVDQSYTFVTTVPEDALCVLVWCSFQYVQHLSVIRKAIFDVSKVLGLAHFSLQHIQKPHTIEEVFWLKANESEK